MKININNLIKKYKTNIALDNINLELSNGVYGLVGPNGAGKSTFMNILSGIITNFTGDIEIDECKYLSEDYFSNLGYLPQYSSYYNAFSTYEFLDYIAVLKNVQDRESRITEVLSLVNLLSQKDKKVKVLSGGMKQRLGIAQALLNDPKLLLLDEPTAGLDPQERIRLKNILGQLSKNKIIIVSTHIISDMENLADYIILLKESKLINCQSPAYYLDEVKDKYYQIEVTDEELEEIKKAYIITNIRKTNDGYQVKAIIDQESNYHKQTIIPTLEDVYLYYYGEKNDL